MSFSSLQFLLFFPVVAAIYYLLPHRLRWVHLLIASCVFYTAFIPAYLVLVLAMAAVDYSVALAMARADDSRRKLYLAVSLTMNLGTLVFFKYYNFAVENVNAVLSFAHVRGSAPALDILLPLGLSFHTFQAMSYTIDVYRGDQEPERHFGIYALYMLFFPRLSAGPIERAQHLLPQLRAEHPFDYGRVTDGLRQMAWGFFKKTVVADRLALGVDTIYREPRQYGGVELTLASVFFALQLYADFSGYSDIAVGADKVFGIDVTNNFRRPYFATNLSEFWRRWHISLYSWFNDYVFSPLAIAMRHRGQLGVVLAVVLTFTLSGLWHGAAWGFLAWGLLQGLAMAFETLTRKRRAKLIKLPSRLASALGVALTFSFVCFTLIFVRARTLSDAVYIVTHLGSGLADFAGNALRPGHLALTVGSLGYYKEDFVIVMLATLVMLVVELVHERLDLRSFFAAKPAALRWAAYYALGASILLYGAHNATQTFIYVQF